MPLSNTGHKGISASLDADGNPWRYQIAVQWNGRVLRAHEVRIDLDEAIAIRNKFERKLDKPRTDLHIREGSVGSVYPSVNGQNKDYWIAHYRGARRAFSVAKYGLRGARQRALKARIKLVERDEPKLARWLRRQQAK